MTEMPPYLAVKDEDKNSGQNDSDSSSDVDDWDSPLCFDQPRHLEPIRGAERVEHTWRVKEKVRDNPEYRKPQSYYLRKSMKTNAHGCLLTRNFLISCNEYAFNSA